MNIFIVDTEFISISKSKSSFEQLVKFKKIKFPEIFQFSMIEISDFDNLKILSKYNFYIKTKHNIPSRLIKLTNLNLSKYSKARNFKDFLKSINRIIKNKSLIICNGEDIELLNLNTSFNNEKKLKKKINLLNLRTFIKKETGLSLETEKLKKYFKIKNIKHVHDSLEDCKIILHSLKKLKKKKNYNLYNKIQKNLKEIKI